MRLEEYSGLLERMPLPAADQTGDPDQQTLIKVRALVSDVIGDREFLTDCIERELRLIEKMSCVRRGFVPFATLPRTGIHLAFGYWPPASSVAPHEHTAWAVTGVFRNQLQVVTFDREETYRRGELVGKNCFEAPAGKVGYIYGPCIHQPKNVSSQWSLSFHVISPRDGQYPDGPPDLVSGMAAADGILSTGTISRGMHPAVMLARQQMAYLEQLTKALLSMKVGRCQEVLRSLYAIGPSKVRVLIEDELPTTVPPETHLRDWTLEKAHEALSLTCNRTDDGICLVADSGAGYQEVLRVNEIGREALGIVARHPLFAVDDLPGNLRQEDRATLAMALENSGYFRRVKQ